MRLFFGSDGLANSPPSGSGWTQLFLPIHTTLHGFTSAGLDFSYITNCWDVRLCSIPGFSSTRPCHPLCYVSGVCMGDFISTGKACHEPPFSLQLAWLVLRSGFPPSTLRLQGIFRLTRTFGSRISKTSPDRPASMWSTPRQAAAATAGRGMLCFAFGPADTLLDGLADPIAHTALSSLKPLPM